MPPSFLEGLEGFIPGLLPQQAKPKFNKRKSSLRQCQIASLGVESLEKLGSGFLYQGRGRSGKRASNATTV